MRINPTNITRVLVATTILSLSFGQVHAEKYSKADLTKFIQANTYIYQIQQQAGSKIKTIKDPEKRKELARELDKQYVAIVQKIGLDVNDYNAISVQAKNDKNLQKRITKIVQSMQKKSK